MRRLIQQSGRLALPAGFPGQRKQVGMPLQACPVGEHKQAVAAFQSRTGVQVLTIDTLAPASRSCTIGLLAGITVANWR
jgi:hypothetical protein